MGSSWQPGKDNSKLEIKEPSDKGLFHLNFAKKCLGNCRMNNIFQINSIEIENHKSSKLG